MKVNPMLFESCRLSALDVRQIASEETREQVKAADVVVGFDLLTGGAAIFFGLDALKSIVKTQKTKRLTPIAFNYDQSGDELEYLVAAVTVLKGRCDYNVR